MSDKVTNKQNFYTEMSMRKVIFKVRINNIVDKDGKTKSDNDSSEMVKRLQNLQNSIFVPAENRVEYSTVEEVANSFKALKGRTASGPDGA